MSTPLPVSRRSQAERSAAMRNRLADAAISSLIDNGYAHTTSVEISRRAGVTRGALNHHFPTLVTLLTEVLERLYSALEATVRAPDTQGLEALIRHAWAQFSRPEYKAVIEIWLAARNDPSLGKDLAPAITRLNRLFEPSHNPALRDVVGNDPARSALYHVAAEAMIGLALGRATAEKGQAAHENTVIDTLAGLARERDGGRGAS